MNRFLVFLFVLLICPFCFAESIEKELLSEIKSDIKTPIIKTEYNYESLRKIPVKLVAEERIRNEKEIYEGQKIKFRATKNTIYKGNVVVQRGQIVEATVKTIIPAGMNGIPASIILGDFTAGKIPPSQLVDTYEIVGQDRSLLVFPLKWALTILPPTGSLTNLIMGGHAKMKIGKIITIYYYPEWI